MLNCSVPSCPVPNFPTTLPYDFEEKKTTSSDFAQISFDPKTETDDQGYDFVLVSGSEFGVADVCNLLELPANQGR